MRPDRVTVQDTEVSEGSVVGSFLAEMAVGVATPMVIRPSSLGQLMEKSLHPGHPGVGTDVPVLDGYQTGRDTREQVIPLVGYWTEVWTWERPIWNGF